MSEQPKPHRGWKPGQSGNPGGRPKIVAEVQALARARSPEAIETLCEIMANKKVSAAARVTAASAILDRAYGRPSQTVNTGHADKPFDQMTDAELMAIAALDDDKPEDDAPHPSRAH